MWSYMKEKLLRLKNMLFYADITKEEFLQIKPMMEWSNRMAAQKFSIISTLLLIIMYILSYFSPGFESSRGVHIAGLFASLMLVIMSLCSKKSPIFTYVQVYVSTFVFYTYGIAIGLYTRPEEQTVTFMVFLILLPLIFVDRPLRMMSNLIFYVVVFIIGSCFVKQDPVRSVDIVDAILYGLLSMLSFCVIYRARVKNYLMTVELKAVSEFDKLTGLNNRNSYEWRIKAYPTVYNRTICCVYVDVNGLHEVNNTLGHQAGDDMLRFIADAVKKYFGDKHSYRIGGDEFVTFIFDMSLSDIRNRLRIMETEILDENYHAAIGYSFTTELGTDISKLVSDAEANMYKEKTEYYKMRERVAR